MTVLVNHDASGERLYTCNTVAEAEAFIAGMLHVANPEQRAVIHAGEFSISAPEELVNPPRRGKA